MNAPLLSLVTLAAALVPSVLAAEELALHRFERKQLTDVYFSEGAGFGDINGDGKTDLVYGPHWYAGPEWEEAREIYKAVPQNKEGYADSFFNWVHDVNGDGRPDVLLVGLPGTPAFLFENPGPEGLGAPWKKHKVLDSCGNESPQLVNLVGDAMPELVCMKDGMFGYAAVNREKPLGPWEFHAISEKAGGVFTHGLGVGDVNGDGRLDILHAKGWLEQPAENAGGSRWPAHEAKLSSAYGGADMFAYDVDGDGDSDIITSEAAHEFGLSWYEQKKEGNDIEFVRHPIVGSKASESRYGILFSELHSVALADIDGDGLKDIVTGKTYYSHHKGSPLWDAGAVTYWFRLVRTKEGVDWVPFLADGEAGIGRQLSVADINRDGLPDIVMGGMKGGHVLIHQKEIVDQAAYAKAQPQPKKVVDPPPPAVPEKTIARRGPKSPIEKKTGKVVGALEGESLKFTTTGGKAAGQPMGPFTLEEWSGDSQLWWTGAKPGDKLTLDLPEKEGKVDVEVVLTCAKDYGIVRLSLDGKPLGQPIDLYGPDVVTTGVLTFSEVQLKAGPHKLEVEIVGANPKADKAYMFGLDYVRLKGEKDTFTSAEDGIAPTDATGRVLNLDFETGTLADWTATGKAFEGQPIKGDTVASRRNDMYSGHQGKYWIGGFEKLQDPPQGTLSSVPFKVTHPWASYLHNGGPQVETRVEIVLKEGDKVIFKSSGTESEALRPVVVDLKDYAGKEIYIRLVDQHSGHWGHLNFDHFRFHATKPTINVTRTAPAVLAADEYPFSGLTAAEAVKAMKLPPGFRAIVGAAEPEVKQPIAMAIDDRGRVWIAEAYEYPIRAKGEKGRDRILIFEDTDGDGTLDKQKVFATGLNLVSGLEVGFGGVWVGAAPYLMFIPDANRDDVPDGEPKILLDGWGYQDTHETLNAFIWGPDGWLYGCHGVFTHSRVGKPGTPDRDREPINAGVWRYHPTRHEFEVFAHGTSNPWGVDFNDHGQAFITACVIPHLFHMIQGGRYQRQGGQHFNPYTYRDIVTIADHLHYLGNNPHGGNNRSDSAGGGHAHAGAMIYLGGLWPDEYRNALFMNNIHGQRLNIDTLHAKGSGYVGSHGPDFLLTGDRASQILNLRYGPDGNAWMIDWYDMQACHTGDPNNHNRTNGRIYKIQWQGTRVPPTPIGGAAKDGALLAMSDLQLAELVLHKNDWYVRHSRRLLQERAAASKLADEAIARLTAIATTHADDTRRLRAAWALHVTGNLTEELGGKLLGDASPYVRGWAIQMGVERTGGKLPANLVARLESLAAKDPSPVVRLAIASALQQMPPAARWSILESLAAHPSDANDHNLPLMIWYAAEPLATADPERALAWAMSAGQSIPLLREFMLRRIGSSAGPSLAVLVRGLGKANQPGPQLTFLAAIRAALAGQRQVAAPEDWAKVYAELAKSSDENVRLQATALGVTFGDQTAMAALRERVVDRAAAIEARRVALESLLDAKDSKLVLTLQTLAKEEPALREVALRGLAQYVDPRTAPLLVELYAKLSAAEKRIALATLAARAESGIVLLKAVQAKQVPATDLTADVARQLDLFKNDELARLLASVWGTVRESPAEKLTMIAHFKTLVDSKTHPAVDLALGRSIFAKTCQKCHVLYGVGGKIGPDLTGSNRANIDYLLSNVVDPSAVMAKEYQPLVLNLLDGRMVTGLLKAEDDKSVTVQTADNALTIPKNEIEDRLTSPKSMMPDDQLKQFSEHEVRSLIGYLQGKSQTPILASPESVKDLFNGKDLTGWTGEEGLWTVENGELVGRTDGLNHNEWIVNEQELGDFSLKVEVKLVKNEGNSGIQFRSRAKGHEVEGYQADIGAGWWGKLYEEHGRALLWDKSGEAHIKPGEWTTYEIRAVGSKLQTFLNGQPCVDLDDPKGAKRGILALQLHSGGKTEVRYRNFKLELLEAPNGAATKSP